MNPTTKNPTNRLGKPIPKSLLIAGFSCMMGSSLFAATYKWNGSLTGNLNDVTQWTPTVTGALAWNNEYDVETPGANVSQTANVNIGQMMIGSASGAPAVLNITNQISSNYNTIAAGSSWFFNNAQGTINHTAGLIKTYNTGDAMWILVGCSAGSTGNVGTYNFGGASPGPSIVATGGNANSAGIAIGGNSGNHGVMSLSGYGTINIPAEPFYIGTRDCWGSPNGNGILNITGGNLSINAGYLYVGGHFLTDHGPWAAGNSTALLNVTIDSTGISPINASTVQIDSAASFSANLSGVSPTIGDVYTIINSTNPINGTFFGLAEGSYLLAGSQWFTISYLSNKVTITAAAEPTTLPPWLEEGFNYTSGSTIVGKNGGIGFAGSSWTTTAADTVGTGLSYPGLATAGNGNLHTGNYGGSTRSVAQIGGSVYYMSMLINMHNIETVRCGPELQISNNDGCLFGRVTGGWGMFAPGGGIFGVSNSTGSYKTWTGVTKASDNKTHLLVYKFDSIAKVISMWVDPTVSTTIPTPDATLSTGGNWTVNLGTSFNDIRVFHEQGGCDLDALRFGAYWQAVLPAGSTVSSLSGLTLSSGTLSPAFAAATRSYTTTVTDATITVTPTVTDSTATVTVKGTPVASGAASGAIPLSVGYNRINTVVTAQDGSTTIYGVTVTRNSTFTSWINNYPSLTGSNALPDASPAGDGVSNMMKYALGLDPTQVATNLDGYDGYGIYFGIGSDAQNDPNLSCSVEESTDLINWGPPIYGTDYSSPPSYFEYDLADPVASGQPKVFGRLKVTQTP